MNIAVVPVLLLFAIVITLLVVFILKVGTARKVSLWIVGVMLLILGVVVFALIRLQTSSGMSLVRLTPRESKTQRTDSPNSSFISRNDHSVLVVHDNVDVDYVLYFAGNSSAASHGTHNTSSLTWVDQGTIALPNKRTFGFYRESVNPFQLRVNGQEYDLRQGRVLVLLDDGTLDHRKLFPPLATARDPEAVGKLVADTQAMNQQPALEEVPAR